MLVSRGAYIWGGLYSGRLTFGILRYLGSKTLSKVFSHGEQFISKENTINGLISTSSLINH